MKKCLLLLTVLAACSASAQSGLKDQSVKTTSTQRATSGFVSRLPHQPNEIATRRFVFGGIAVNAAKTDHPLQLINPFAPAEYGSGEANVSADLLRPQLQALKIFTIKF
jgi:hypothetical protein